MALSQERHQKIDNELQRASAYFERLAAEIDPSPDAGAPRAAWAKARAIVAQIEELRWLLAQTTAVDPIVPS
jgi:hypothetical protein